MRGRHWSITINNPEGDGDKIEQVLLESPDVKVFAFQLEEGEKFTPHFQMYIGFRKLVRRTQVSALLGTDAYHAEYARDPRACYLYCQKEDTRISGPWASEWEGTHQGERTDLQRACALIKDSGIDAVVAEMPELLVKFPSGMKELERRLHQDSNEIRLKEVVLIWGPAGTGKSTRARQYPGVRSCAVSKSGFFDYVSSETCLFEEVDEIVGHKLTIPYMCQLLDQWPMNVEVKGGWTRFNPPRIVMTSNIDPQILFGGDHYEAVMRRITTVIRVAHGTEVAGNRNSHPRASTLVVTAASDEDE